MNEVYVNPERLAQKLHDEYRRKWGCLLWPILAWRGLCKLTQWCVGLYGYDISDEGEK